MATFFLRKKFRRVRSAFPLRKLLAEFSFKENARALSYRRRHHRYRGRSRGCRSVMGARVNFDFQCRELLLLGSSGRSNHPLPHCCLNTDMHTATAINP